MVDTLKQYIESQASVLALQHTLRGESITDFSLPKAHVQAPVSGSIILAGLLFQLT